MTRRRAKKPRDSEDSDFDGGAKAKAPRRARRKGSRGTPSASQHDAEQEERLIQEAIKASLVDSGNADETVQADNAQDDIPIEEPPQEPDVKEEPPVEEEPDAGRKPRRSAAKKPIVDSQSDAESEGYKYEPDQDDDVSDDDIASEDSDFGDEVSDYEESPKKKGKGKKAPAPKPAKPTKAKPAARKPKSPEKKATTTSMSKPVMPRKRPAMIAPSGNSGVKTGLGGVGIRTEYRPAGLSRRAAVKPLHRV